MSQRQAHHSPASEKNGAGIDLSEWSGEEPLCSRKRLFCRLGTSSNGRPGGRSRKARRCSIGKVNSRFGRPPKLTFGQAVQNRNWSNAMSKTTPTADIEFCQRLFDHHPEDVIAPLGYAGEALGWLEELFRIIAADEETGKPAKLSIEINIKPAGGKAQGAVILSDKIKAKLPDLPAGDTILFVTTENNLVATDPRQTKLELKDVMPAGVTSANLKTA